jgi:hypothetical protein
MDIKDCFFFVENKSEKTEDNIVRTSCVECMKKEKVENAMFWPGGKKGYGPFKYICHFCKTIIHDQEAK